MWRLKETKTQSKGQPYNKHLFLKVIKGLSKNKFTVINQEELQRNDEHITDNVLCYLCCTQAILAREADIGACNCDVGLSASEIFEGILVHNINLHRHLQVD